MISEASFKVKDLRHVTPEHHMHHLESLPSRIFRFPVVLVIGSIDTGIEIRQVLGEVVARGAVIDETEVQPDDFAAWSGVFISQDTHGVAESFVLVDLVASLELLAE